MSQRRSSSSRASPAPRSSPTFSRTTSTIAFARSSATGEAAKHFIAVTDPGSALQTDRRGRSCSPGVLRAYPASADDIRRCPTSAWCRRPSWGSTCRASSTAARVMAHACASCVPPEQNPGSCSARSSGRRPESGRDKVTLIAISRRRRSSARGWSSSSPNRRARRARGSSPSIASRSARLKSTAPIVCSSICGSTLRRTRRRMPRSTRSRRRDSQSCASRSASRHDLGQEFFRWEIAIAVAGAIIGIDPFNQPDVEASKVAARKLTNAYEKTGALPQESPFCRDGPLALFADERNQAGARSGSRF